MLRTGTLSSNLREGGWIMYLKAEIARVAFTSNQCVCCKAFNGPTVPNDPILKAD